MTRTEAIAFIKSLVSLRESATDPQAIDAPAVYPIWKADVEYKVGDRILFGDVLYKVLQDHTSQDLWIPLESPSLFAKVLIPDENVIPKWEQPDSTNAYRIGDKVTHNDYVWTSIVDNNVWEPGAYGWEQNTEIDI